MEKQRKQGDYSFKSKSLAMDTMPIEMSKLGEPVPQYKIPKFHQNKRVTINDVKKMQFSKQRSKEELLLMMKKNGSYFNLVKTRTKPPSKVVHFDTWKMNEIANIK